MHNRAAQSKTTAMERQQSPLEPQLLCRRKTCGSRRHRCPMTAARALDPLVRLLIAKAAAARNVRLLSSTAKTTRVSHAAACDRCGVDLARRPSQRQQRPVQRVVRFVRITGRNVSLNGSRRRTTGRTLDLDIERYEQESGGR